MDSKNKIGLKNRINLKNSAGNILLCFLVFIWISILAFVIFQYNREKHFKVEILNTSLQSINNNLANILELSNNEQVFTKYIDKLKGKYPDIRITILEANGRIFYDSYDNNHINQMTNHKDRPEVIQALNNGNGYTIRRHSASTSKEYFYSATKFKIEDNNYYALNNSEIIIRSALPYSISLYKTLSTGNDFYWFLILITILISFTGINIIRKFNRNAVLLEEERSRTLKEEREKIRIKKQLTNNINHELKTPVSGINVCLETLINNKHMSAEQQNSFIERSYKEAKRLTSLLNDISTITRIDEAPQMINKSKLNLSQIILDEVYDSLSSKDILPIRVHVKGLGASKITTSSKSLVESSGELLGEPCSNIEILGNGPLLHSIFRNLLDNAIAYSGCRDIYIELLKEEEGKYYFLFSDNGIGVEEEHIPHLFERFYRVDKGRSRKMGGTGLGLSIVKNAILLHNGTIEVKNCINGGLEFKFTLSLK